MRTERAPLSLHAYVCGHENAFLRQVFAPALATLAMPPQAWFFLRYWHGGPHLRLRVHAAADQQLALQRQLEQRFAPWCRTVGPFIMPDAAEHAVTAQRFAALEGVPADAGLNSAPSLVLRPYQPECAKYGGEAGLAIAEPVWHASASTVLAADAASPLDGTRRAGTGLQMALLAARAFGLSAAQAAHFFAACAGVWQAYCPGPASAGLERRLAAQAGELQPLVATIWDGAPAVDVWSVALRQARQRILAQAPALAAAVGGGADPLPSGRLQSYFLSQYLHTNNNRLGINPVEEWLQARQAQGALALHQESTHA